MTPPDLGTLNRRLSLAKLEFLCLVVQHGSVKRTAEALGLPQSSVNARLRSLERHCDATLFVPGQPTIQLTEEGRSVHEWAAETLARGRSLIRELQSLEESEQQGAVLISASMSVGTYLLPPIMAAFLRARPGAHITVTTAEPAGALSDVQRGDADFGIIAGDFPPDDPDLESVLLTDEDLILVAAPDGQPAADAVPLASLRDLPLISPPSGSARRAVLDSFFAAHGTTICESHLGLEHPEAAKQAVIANMGVTLASRSSVEAELQEGLLREIRFLDAKLAYRIYAIRRTDKRLSVVQQALYELVEEEVRRRSEALSRPAGRGAAAPRSG